MSRPHKVHNIAFAVGGGWPLWSIDGGTEGATIHRVTWLTHIAPNVVLTISGEQFNAAQPGRVPLSIATQGTALHY